jgi:hypothetical protein|tara:strand:- start:3352 stop:3570 length:219 start_codon:yes stop_codon:yes gene_type:complete
MTREQLKAVGEALYGPRWQSELSRDLTVAVRTVQRWDAGQRGIPASLGDDLRELLVRRRNKISGLIEKFEDL